MSYAPPAGMKVEADGVVVSRRNKTFIYQACPLCMRKLLPLQNESDSINKRCGGW